jgi:tetratricopeptide (TPR) repeat protein
LALDDPDNVFGVMAAVRDFAGQMVNPDEHWKWRSACENIISASRRAEELLQPFLLVDVCPAESDVFTHPTAPSHSQAPLAGRVTAVTWNVTEETWGEEDSDAFNLPDAVAGGETEARIQAFEHQLLELRNTHKNTDHPEIAVVLHNLGNLSRHAGDLKQSEQYCRGSLRMKRSLYKHEYHPEIAVTLNELGNLRWQAGDLQQAKQCYDESLQMKRSLHGDGDHPEIAVTLCMRWAI